MPYPTETGQRPETKIDEVWTATDALFRLANGVKSKNPSVCACRDVAMELFRKGSHMLITAINAADKEESEKHHEQH